MRLRTMLLLILSPYLLAGAVIVAVLAATGTDGANVVQPSPSEAGYPTATTSGPREASAPDPARSPAPDRLSRDEQLHRDSNMTLYMSSPDASGPMFTGQTTDPQLQHSSDPAFVRELEQHQADIDRMLARGQP